MTKPLASVGDGISQRFVQENLAQGRERARPICSSAPRSFGQARPVRQS